MNLFSPNQVLSQQDLLIAYETVSAHPYWQYWKASDNQLHQVILSLKNPTLSEVIHAIYQGCINPDQKPRWGDKTPDYSFEIYRLCQYFPDAKFIHIIRDVRDVCISLLKQNWHGPTVVQTAEYWSNAVHDCITAGRRLEPHQYLEIAYEDLVLDTENTLKKICRFLQEDYYKSMLKSENWAVEQEPNSYIHPKVRRPPQATDVERWKTELTNAKVAAIERIAGKTMILVGQQKSFVGIRKVHQQSVWVLATLADTTRSIRAKLGLNLSAFNFLR